MATRSPRVGEKMPKTNLPPVNTPKIQVRPTAPSLPPKFQPESPMTMKQPPKFQPKSPATTKQTTTALDVPMINEKNEGQKDVYNKEEVDEKMKEIGYWNREMRRDIMELRVAITRNEERIMKHEGLMTNIGQENEEMKREII